MEDIDRERCKDHFSHLILDQLSRCQLISDQEVVYQSQRTHIYDTYTSQLIQQGLLYRCNCSRAQIWSARLASTTGSPQNTSSFAGLVYPGTCRNIPPLLESTQAHGALSEDHWLSKCFALRIKTSPQTLDWWDRRLGPGAQDVGAEVGDFVIKRSDGPYSYQLCVVADDIEQCVTHIVRGEDLADNTPRQILLYQLFQHRPPTYMHVPLVKNKDGDKLSKQTLAPALDLDSMDKIIQTMKSAASHLGLQSTESTNCSLESLLQNWTHQWSLINPLTSPPIDH